MLAAAEVELLDKLLEQAVLAAAEMVAILLLEPLVEQI
jgi:hypothetical protein